MKKIVPFILVTFFLSLNYGLAQSQKINVDTKNAALFNINSAFLSKAPVNKDSKQSFILSLSLPFQFKTLLPQTSLTLTAYKEDGSVFGMSNWCSLSGIALNKLSDNLLQINLDVNPNLQGANTYGISMSQKSSSAVESVDGSCDECADLAISVCGAGQVGSLTCPTNPKGGPVTPCSFTCKP